MSDDKEYDKWYRETHKEEIKEYQKEYYQKHKQKMKDYSRQYWYKKGGKPMSKNKECSSYLGIHIAEKVLSKVFKNVQQMPTNNKGYDFLCNKGYKIDVKSSCLYKRKKHSDSWMFRINKNTVADHFLCLAFNNRDDLIPLYLWLLPKDIVDGKVMIRIGKTTVDRWNGYKLNMDRVSDCCDILR